MGILDGQKFNGGLLGDLSQRMMAFGDPRMMQQVITEQEMMKQQALEYAMKKKLFDQQQEELKQLKQDRQTISQYMGAQNTEQQGPVMPGQGLLMGGGHGAMMDGQLDQGEVKGLLGAMAQTPSFMDTGINGLLKMNEPAEMPAYAQHLIAAGVPAGSPQFQQMMLKKAQHDASFSPTGGGDTLSGRKLALAQKIATGTATPQEIKEMEIISGGGGGNGFRVNTQTYVNEDGGRIIAKDPGDGIIKYYDERSGNELRALPSGYVPESQMYVGQRAEAGRDLSALRLAAGVEQNISSAATKELEPIKEVARTLDQLEVSLLSNSPVSKADIQKGLANITAGGQRAMAELDLSANFGDLPTRIGNRVSVFATGELPDAAKAEVLDYIRQIRSGFVDASKAEIMQRHRAKAERSKDFGVDPNRVFGQESRSLLTPDAGGLSAQEQAELEQLRKRFGK